MTLNNTRTALNALEQKIREEIDRFYDPRLYRTVESLCSLIEKENQELTRLQQKLFGSVREVACGGMEADGVMQPKLLWAQNIIGNLKRPRFAAIRHALPVVKEAETGSSHSDDAKSYPVNYAGVGGVVVGGGMIVAGCIVTSIALKLSLLGLGALAATGGVVLLTRTGQSPNHQEYPAAPRPAQDNERLIRDILQKARQQNKRIVHEWISNLTSLIDKSVLQSAVGGDCNDPSDH